PVPASQPLETSLSPAPVHNPTGLISRPFGTEIASLSKLGIPTLEVTSNTSGAKKSYPLVKEVINIGRDATNDIVINDVSVSGKHLQIVRQDNSLILIHPHPDRQQTQNG